MLSADLPGFIDNQHGAARECAALQKFARGLAVGEAVTLEVEHLLALRCECEGDAARRLDCILNATQDVTFSRACSAAKERHEIVRRQNFRKRDLLVRREVVAGLLFGKGEWRKTTGPGAGEFDIPLAQQYNTSRSANRTSGKYQCRFHRVLHKTRHPTILRWHVRPWRGLFPPGDTISISMGFFDEVLAACDGLVGEVGWKSSLRPNGLLVVRECELI